MNRLKKRWGITSNVQAIIILIVFAITGSASAWLSKPFCVLLGITKEDFGGWFTLIRLLIIFPIYQVLLVAIGTIFGQFRFFGILKRNCLKTWDWDFYLKIQNLNLNKSIKNNRKVHKGLIIKLCELCG
jgi:O-antigen ligase